MPKFSVIMPAYNAEAYIGEAINSMLTQTFADWELVVVDDGSKDGTAAILAGYGDARIKVVRQENGGEASARNTGLRNASGELIAFLDSDDLYYPDTLENRLAYLDAHPEHGALVADGRFCDAQGREQDKVSSIRAQEHVGDILEPLVLNPATVSVPVGITARRALILKHGLWFDTTVGYGTDWDFWTRLARFTHFGYLPTITYKYRVHGSNMTSMQGDSRRRDWIKGRMKVLDSSWFGGMSEQTRFRFFQMLAMELLGGEPERQREILTREEARRLPASLQARLWSNVASDYLRQGAEPEFAAECLRRAIELAPGDRKSRVLAGALKLGPGAAQGAVKAWRLAIDVARSVRSVGRRSAKPVPGELVSKP